MDVSIDVDLEEWCVSCIGSGSIINGICEKCNGFGSTPTRHGQEIIDFVERRFGIKALLLAAKKDG